MIIVKSHIFIYLHDLWYFMVDQFHHLCLQILYEKDLTIHKEIKVNIISFFKECRDPLVSSAHF